MGAGGKATAEVMACRVYNMDLFSDLVTDIHAQNEQLKKEKVEARAARTYLSTEGKGSRYSIMSQSSQGSRFDVPLTAEEQALKEHKQHMENPAEARARKNQQSHSNLFASAEENAGRAARLHAERVRRARQRKEASFRRNWHALHHGEGYKLDLEWKRRLELLDNEKKSRIRHLSRDW